MQFQTMDTIVQLLNAFNVFHVHDCIYADVHVLFVQNYVLSVCFDFTNKFVYVY